MLKMIQKTLFAATAAALLVPSAATAKDVDFGKIYTECGLGGMIGHYIDDKDTSYILAITTNVVWDLGTTASTSYSTSDNTCMNKKAKVAAFINQSYETLEKEIAQGEGKYLDTLAVLSVEDETSKVAYTEKLRGAFSQIVADEAYPTMSRYEKVEKLYNIAI